MAELNKAQKLLVGLRLLNEYKMEELEINPCGPISMINNVQNSAYVCVHIPFEESLSLEIAKTTVQSLYDLGWTMEQDYEYWIFRD